MVAGEVVEPVYDVVVSGEVVEPVYDVVVSGEVVEPVYDVVVAGEVVEPVNEKNLVVDCPAPSFVPSLAWDWNVYIYLGLNK